MKRSKTERLTNEIFIQRAKEIYGDKFTFDNLNYINNKTPVIITCPIHGDFKKRPDKFLYAKQGCPKCNNSYHPSTVEWIEAAKKKFGDKFAYDKVIYITNQTPVIITCPIHGDFSITPRAHMESVNGCPQCFHETHMNKNNILNIFIEKHGDRFDYSKLTYNGSNDKITITCPVHGDFITTPKKHINSENGGCPKCSSTYSPTTEEWIKRCEILHGNKYDYSKSTYIDSNTYTTITCPIHGDFSINARQHARGQGCPKCGHIISKGETEVLDYIKEILGDEIEILSNDRKVLDGKELDIYIPSKNIAIEFDGLFWHSDAIRQDKTHLLNKTLQCEKNGIQLIHIFEDEWKFKNDICKSRLRNLLGFIKKRIFARKCIVNKLTYSETKEFMNNNHIQGTVVSKYNYGLFYNNELISVMTFGKLRTNLGTKHKEGVFEMLRFANKIDYVVVGGASKLLSHFINELDPDEIISYADRRWSIGNLYEKLGFQFIKNTDINYFYSIDGNKRVNRFSLRKDILVSKYGCPSEMTEKKFCESKGWFRIYDCGCKLYSLKRKAGL